MITLYIYDKQSSVYLGRLVGSNISDVIADIDGDKDFTLISPPNNYDKWQWDGLQWIKDDINDQYSTAPADGRLKHL